MAGILGFKVALCFAYFRITNRNSRVAYKRVIWACMIFSILTHVGGILVLFFQCSPVRKSVRPRIAGKCLDNAITFYVLAAISIICDLIIFLLPIPLLLKVQINTRRKVALIAIFLLGLFTTLCSIMRMVQISVIYKTGNSTMLVLWGTIEMNVGVSDYDDEILRKQLADSLSTDLPHKSTIPDPTLHLLLKQGENEQLRNVLLWQRPIRQ